MALCLECGVECCWFQHHFFDELFQKETLSKHSQECTTKFSHVCSAIKFRLSRVLYAFFLAQSRNRESFLRFSHLLLSKPWKFRLCSSGEIYFYEDCRKLELFPVFNELTYAVLQDYEKLKMLTQIELYGVALRIDLDWIKDGIKNLILCLIAFNQTVRTIPNAAGKTRKRRYMPILALLLVKCIF